MSTTNSSAFPAGQVLVDVACTEPVTYRAHFTNMWTFSRHTPNYPTNPHWSPPVVVTHSKNYTMWAVGSSASAGVKLVAETGATGTLLEEIPDSKVKPSSVCGVGVGKVQFMDKGEDDQEVYVDVDESCGYLSMITMIAPSPDWFAGVNTRAICVDGKWVSVTVDLQPMDAGTDAGQKYRAENNPESGGSISEITPKHPAAVATKVFVESGAVKPVARLVLEPYPRGTVSAASAAASLQNHPFLLTALLLATCFFR